MRTYVIWAIIAALMAGISVLCAIEREIGRREILDHNIRVECLGGFTERMSDGRIECIGKPVRGKW